jgi:ribose transport system ATP-binding protein
MSGAERETILRTRGLTKKYGDVEVLSDINLEVRRGECHAVVGENGAGKTTLMNILGGIIHPSSGSFEFYGRSCTQLHPRESLDIGISIIHQDFALVPTLTVKENIFLGKLEGNFLGIIKNYSALDREARRILARLGEENNIRPSDVVGRLSTSKQQIVEIAKALSENPKLLIMDEPTTSLTKAEVKNLFRIIRTIKREGIAVIYVSHILEEVLEISDRVTVLRDGGYVGTKTSGETSLHEIITMMVGRTIDLYDVKTESRVAKEAETVLEVRDLGVDGIVENVSFTLRRGEILGFAGLVGSGRSEVAKALFGYYRKVRGRVYLEGREIKAASPREAMEHGIGLLPEDRRWQGFVPTMSVLQNMSLASIRGLARMGIPSLRKERELADMYVKYLDIKAASVHSPILSLSGGNQQKVILSKWLATKSKVLIVDEPTQGIDVGSKSEIHKILHGLAGSGVAIILISSELPEILSLADRILVMRQGTKSGELDIRDATQEKIMYLATLGVDAGAREAREKGELR